MKHQLLPRSTGLLFTLRTLKLNIPDFPLYDITVSAKRLPGLTSCAAHTCWPVRSATREYLLQGEPLASIKPSLRR